ncbi:MAG: hypothetical protein BWY89_01489 [Bacteroidetes bacterium ADurb.BinA012]|nr:MAG: hypothetical protein BWY89_01489 [Bacteroidetes bacterium ADurb.BinA012]
MGVLGIAVHFARFLPVQKTGRIILLDLTGKPGFEPGRVKTRYQLSTTDTINKIFPKILQIVPDGGQRPHPGNYYTPHLWVTRDNYLAFSSIYLMASPTVLMLSA